MNRIFRVIWSASTGVWQAVSEVAKTGGKFAKSSSIKVVVGGSLMAGAGLFTLATPALAELPTGGQVVGGTGRISQTGPTRTVTQDSQRLATDWQSFSTGNGHAVQFVQPDARAVALGPVLGSDVSLIQGGLEANGQVLLAKPNGILFTPTAQVDTGGLVTSTLNLGTADLMAGHTRFSDSSGAEVNNQGRITAAEGGQVALPAARIVNTGDIQAQGGQILMGSGRQITLDLGGPVKLQVDEGVLNAQIEQGGALRAEGGQVYVSSKSAEALTRSVINQAGLIEASGLVSRGGQIVLEADAITRVATSQTQATGATGGGQALAGDH